MVEAGKKVGTDIVYVEVPDGSHASVAAPQFGPTVDFFARPGQQFRSGGVASAKWRRPGSRRESGSYMRVGDRKKS